MATPKSSAFAQQLWVRYTRFSTRAPHAQLARRIYRMHGDRLPLLTAVQRRWLPAYTAPFQTPLGLPYVQLSRSPDLPSLALPTGQRRSDIPPRSPGVAGPGRVGLSAMPNPMRAVQRAAAPLSIPEDPAGGARGAPRVPAEPFVVAALPLARSVQRQASPPGDTTPLPTTDRQLGIIPPETSGPLSPPGAVQRSVVPPSASPGVQRPTALGETIFQRHGHLSPWQTMPDRVATVPAQMIYRSLSVPVSQTDTVPLPPSPSTSSSLPVVQRQIDAGLSVRQLPLAERGLPTRASAMRTAVPSVAATASRFVSADLLSPVSQVAPSPVLGMAILQRHLTTSQSGRQRAVFSGQSMPALPLIVQRAPLAPVAPDSVGHMGLLPAGVLPLARAVDQPAVRSGDDRGPSSLSPLPTAHTPLPLVLPLANGQAASVQRQTEGFGTSNAMPATTNVPPSASVSTPNGTGATSAVANRSQTDELAEIVWRKLMRRLAVEGERRGRRIWP